MYNELYFIYYELQQLFVAGILLLSGDFISCTINTGTFIMLKLPLHHCPLASTPIGSFYSSFYMTLVSIIQGFAVGILFENFYDNLDINDPNTIIVIPRYVVSFFSFTLVWHKFINFKQYNSWTLTYQDTMLVMLFAVVEGGLIVFSSNSINTEYNFSGVYYIIYSVSFLAAIGGYNHALMELSKSYNRLMTEQHYEKCKFNNKCGEKAHEIVIAANHTSIALCKKFGLSALAVSIIVFIFDNCGFYKALNWTDQLLVETLFALPAIVLYIYFVVKIDIKTLFDKWEHYYMECNNDKVTSRLLELQKAGK